MEDLPLRGDALRARLKQLGMTQTDLSDALGIRPQSVQHWVAGRTGPNSHLLPKVIEALQLELETSPVDQRLTELGDEVSRLRDLVTALAERVDRLSDQRTGANEDVPAIRPAKASRRLK
jgi:transcriptional regulator with XRE-family HTH domain